MLKWFGGACLGIMGMIALFKYPDDVWNFFMSILMVLEHMVDTVIGQFRKSQATGG